MMMRKKESYSGGSNPRPSTPKPTAYCLKIELHVLTNLDFDDLTVAALAVLTHMTHQFLWSLKWCIYLKSQIFL